MASFSIGEVEKISGVKAHVLRYWEEVIPSIAPKMTSGGHREYTQQDLHTILRLKYLIQEKKFTITGARNQLLKESALVGVDEKNVSLYNDIVELKTELLDLLRLVQKDE
ncbi:MAG: MerR family transcriptional regulator [Treponemataceae bacterium]